MEDAPVYIADLKKARTLVLKTLFYLQEESGGSGVFETIIVYLELIFLIMLLFQNLCRMFVNLFSFSTLAPNNLKRTMSGLRSHPLSAHNHILSIISKE
jgi:hypothetical protein